MALTFLHLLFAISAFNLCGSSTFASAGTPQSLGAELVPGGVINGCCSQAFLNATIAEMSNILSVATAQSLLSHGLTMNNLVVNPFVLINTNLCLVRQRNLLRGSETENGDAVQRKAKTYTNTCGACTSHSCSSYCSGCYLCSSDRRHLERDLQLGGLLGGVGGLIGDVLGVTLTILNAVVSDVSAAIGSNFTSWLSTGPGATLVNGCLGDLSQLQIIVSLSG